VTIAQLTKQMESVVGHTKELDSKIQKVSAQIKRTKPIARFAGVISH
jgi:hypothetical protein